MNQTDILRRCCEHPTEHLAEPTLSQFNAYCYGYEFHTGFDAEKFDLDAFTEAVKTDYDVRGDWPVNVAATGFLVAAERPSEALAKYLHYRNRLAKPIRGQRTPHSCGKPLDFLDSMDGLRKRPKMYLGNDASASHIWSMLSGYRWAETDASSNPAEITSFLVHFQDWVEQRFPFSRGIPWYRTFYFLSISSSENSLRTFFSHFDLFRAGEPPTSLSQTARTMMANIVEHSNCDPSSIEHILKKIAPI